MGFASWFSGQSDDCHFIRLRGTSCMNHASEHGDPHDPTPAEIEERSAGIRKTWNERTRRRRAGWPKEIVDRRVTWEVPMIDLSDLVVPASDNGSRMGEPQRN